MPLIKDKHNRVHDYLRISLTERCNLRCFYCMPADGIELSPKSHIMTCEEILEMAQTFVDMGVKKIRLTGGEPLVRKDARKIIEGLGKLPVELAITTNGIIVDKYIDTFLQAGIKSVNVSLDTLSPPKFEMITRRNYFQRVRDNIELLLKHGFKVKINTVLIRGVNHHEITDFVGLTKKLPLHIRFIEFMPFGGNRWDWNKCISLDEVLTAVKEYYPPNTMLRIKDQPHDTSKNYKIKGYQGTFAVISSVTEPFCATCNRIRLTADGKLKNCLFGTTETDLLQPLRNGENIQKLIMNNVGCKAAKRGGMAGFEDFLNLEKHEKNRSMVRIGG